MGICLHRRGEVLYRNKFMVASKECRDKTSWVKPLVRGPLEKPVEEVVPVNVCNCPFHGIIKTARALTFRPRLCTA